MNRQKTRISKDKLATNQIIINGVKLNKWLKMTEKERSALRLKNKRK